MKKRIIIFIIYALSLLVIVSGKLYVDYTNNKQLKQMIVKEESKALFSLIVAYRQNCNNVFTNNHITYDNKTKKLLSERRSIDVANKFSKIINNKIIIRTISNRPRNQKNKVNDTDAEIISYFKKNQKEKLFFKDTDTAYYYAKPIYIEQSCLKCHGKKEDAMPFVRDNYGNISDYKINELIEIINIITTNKNINDNIGGNYKKTFFSVVTIYLSLILLGYLMMRFIVKNERRFSEKLEKQVIKKTKELSKLNTELKNENENSVALNEELNQNIEELKTSKENVEKQKNIIQESEKKLSTITNSAKDAIILIDNSGNVAYWNKAAHEIFGYTKDEIFGKNLHNILAGKKHQPIASEAFTLFRKTGKGKAINNTVQLEAIRKNGEIFPIELSLSALKLNEKWSAVGIVKDISERKKLELEIRVGREKIDEAHNEITESINYAKTIQNALLTPKEKINEYFADNFIFFKAKDIVSGDFYYLNKVGKHVIFATADCTGHGVPGGFITMLGITYIHEMVRNSTLDNPGMALDNLRERFKASFKTFGEINHNGLDIALCKLNIETNVLQYAGAYNPLIIIRNNELIEYKATKNPIGFFPEEVNFKYHEIQLQNDDMLYVYSDGFQDQFGGDRNKRFMSKKFKKLLLKINNLPMQEQEEKLSEVFTKWKGTNAQTDDILVMGIKII